MVIALGAGSSRALSSDKPEACPGGEEKTDQGCRKSPQLISKTPPKYPSEARQKGIQGSVELEGVISEAGTITDIKVVKSTADEAKYKQDFEQAAIEAFQAWRYTPATINGKPVPTRFTVAIAFSL